MARFDYYEAKDIQSCLELLERFSPEAKIAAGATDLLVQISQRKLVPKHIISIARVEALRGLRMEEGGLAIGPLTTMSELLASQLAQEKLPALYQAAAAAASPQVRNMATIGGNLGTGSPSGDLLPPLMAYDARIHLQSPSMARDISLGELLLGPQKTCLGPQELIVKILIPAAALNGCSAFRKIGKRKALAISIANAASWLDVAADGEIKQARIALGAVAPTVVRAQAAEDFLRGRALSAAAIEQAAALVTEAVSPITDGRATAWYRGEVAQVLAKRTLLQSAGLEENEGGSDADAERS